MQLIKLTPTNLSINRQATENLYKLNKDKIKDYLVHKFAKNGYKSNKHPLNVDSFYSRTIIYNKEKELKNELKEAGLSIQAIDISFNMAMRNIQNSKFNPEDELKISYKNHTSTTFSYDVALEIIKSFTHNNKFKMFAYKVVECPKEFHEFAKKTMFERSEKRRIAQKNIQFQKTYTIARNFLKENELHCAYLRRTLKDPIVYSNDNVLDYIVRNVKEFDECFDQAMTVAEFAKTQGKPLNNDQIWDLTEKYLDESRKNQVGPLCVATTGKPYVFDRDKSYKICKELEVFLKSI